VPRASRKTFTLRELARLARTLADDDSVRVPVVGNLPDRLRVALPLLAGRRGSAGVATPEEDSVPDPYRRGDDAFRRAGDLIDEATSCIAEAARTVLGRA
jgi:protein-tyrosine phosphatase